MRRPSFCCEQHGEGGEAACRPQGGGGSTLDRVRRFLAASLGGRHSASRTGGGGGGRHRCKEELTPPPTTSLQDSPAPVEEDVEGPEGRTQVPEVTGVTLCVCVGGVVGRPLEDVMTRASAEGEEPAHGVPALVHALCCSMLTHGVDYDTLVGDDWCSDTMRARVDLDNNLEEKEIKVDLENDVTAAAGLLRLFLEELPHALLPQAAVNTLYRIVSDSQTRQYTPDCAFAIDEGGDDDDDDDDGVGDDLGGRVFDDNDDDDDDDDEEDVVMQVRRVLHRRLPRHNLSLLRYLAAFLHQLCNSNHNTCPVPRDSLSQLLGRVLIGCRTGGVVEGLATANQLADIILRRYNQIFQAGEDILGDTDDNSDGGGSSPCSEDSSSRDDDDDDDGNDFTGEDDTTTSSAEEFRSPPVSPIKITTNANNHISNHNHNQNHHHNHHNHNQQQQGHLRENNLNNTTTTTNSVHLDDNDGENGEAEAGRDTADDLSSCRQRSVEVCGGPSLWVEERALRVDKAPSSSPIPDHATQPKTTLGPSNPQQQQQQQRKRKEHTEGEAGEHDPKVIRSASEKLAGLEVLRGPGGPFTKNYVSSRRDSVSSTDSLPDPRSPQRIGLQLSRHDAEDDDDDDDDEPLSQSADSSCVSAQEYWETGGESDVTEGVSRDAFSDILSDGGSQENPADSDDDDDDEDNSHEARRESERSYPRPPQSSGRTHRRRQRRRHHHTPSSSSSSEAGTRCQSSSEEDKGPSYLSSLTSEDDEPPTRYDPIPRDITSYDPQPIINSEPAHEPSPVLRELLSDGEPVTSDRGRWGGSSMRDSDPWHRTAPRYSRYEDDDMNLLSPRGNFSDSRECRDDHTLHPKPPGHTAVKIVMKNINGIKKKIKRYEEEFEAAFGYRPSHSEKMKHKDIQKYMNELTKARKELKQMKEDVAGLMNVPTVFPLSLLRCQESSAGGNVPLTTPGNGTNSGAADTLRQVEERLHEKRLEGGRPRELSFMTSDQMHDEKTALQKALLYYESVHGRPTTREDRDLARPLYDRYRQVKRVVMRSGSRAKENLLELAPIREHEEMDFTTASPHHRSSLQEGEMTSPKESFETTIPTTKISMNSGPLVDYDLDKKNNGGGGGQRATFNLGDLHALPISELRERKKEAREEKKRLRRALRDFEEKFEKDTGRKVQKEDRGPMEQTYLDYKHAKAKLRLLEALLSKHDPVKV